jgi:hypothetical protein
VTHSSSQNGVVGPGPSINIRDLPFTSSVTTLRTSWLPFLVVVAVVDC